MFNIEKNFLVPQMMYYTSRVNNIQKHNISPFNYVGKFMPTMGCDHSLLKSWMRTHNQLILL